jgi:hypothetical protein
MNLKKLKYEGNQFEKACKEDSSQRIMYEENEVVGESSQVVR